MKKIIELGNNIKAEYENGEYKIISANGSVIRLDEEGEFLSCENVVAQQEADKRRKYLSRYKKIGEIEREKILEWFNKEVIKENFDANKKFFIELKKALEKVNYDFYVAMLLDTHHKIELLSNYKKILPKYEATRANSDETNLFIAYNLMLKDWSYEDVFGENNITFILVMEKMYVLKISE